MDLFQNFCMFICTSEGGVWKLELNYSFYQTLITSLPQGRVHCHTVFCFFLTECMKLVNFDCAQLRYGLIFWLNNILTKVVCYGFCKSNLMYFQWNNCGRFSVVGIGIRCGLGDPGIESRWGQDFPHPSSPAVLLTQPPVQWIPALFSGSKASGAWRWPPPLAPRLKKE